jgi:hypothetical protein
VTRRSGCWPADRSTRFAPDWLDGVADVMAAQGGSMASYDYDPYGNPRSDGTAAGPGTVDNPVRFAGMYQGSALGSRSLARTYDSVTGRCGGVDPVPGVPAVHRRGP